MSQWEEVELMDATHVEINGVVHELGIRPDGKHSVIKYNRYHIDVYMESAGWQRIHVNAFPLLGIRCLRKFKPTPIEFIYTVGGGIAPPNEAYGKTFLCVEILEDEE